jgi:hypothetical protein
MENFMKKTYFLLSLALLASGTVLAMNNNQPFKKVKLTVTGKTDIHDAYQCPNCDYIGGIIEEMYQHIKTHHSKKLYQCHCPGCNYTTMKEQFLRLHIRTHTGERPYKCNYKSCNFAAALEEKYKLDQHMKTHYICPTCNKGKTNEFALSEHLQKHPMCGCGHRALDTQELNSHLQQHQQQLNEARLLHILANANVQNAFSADTLLSMNRQ